MTEMNAERLERIKNTHEKMIHTHPALEHTYEEELYFLLMNRDFAFLIKQAERTAKLEAEVLRLKLDAAKSIPLYSRRKLQADKNRYEKALKDIRDISTGTVNIWAKKALEESK